MRADELKQKLTEAADCLYQEKTQEGVDAVLSLAVALGREEKISSDINPLFDALEQGDYILAADVLQHEMAEKIK
jgi:hypothetical protein